MKRVLAAWLAACLLGGPIALPAAHEWRVAQDEAGRHLEKSRGPRIAAEPGAASHRHHDEKSCRVCPCVAKLRAAMGGASRSLAVPEPSSLVLSALLEKHAILFESGGISPRGPPSRA